MKKMFSWTLLLVVLIIFGSGAVAVYTVFFTGDITVPPLRERTVVEAVEELKRLDLVAQIENVASALPEGRVLGQAPEAGTRTRKKQVVVLQVSRGGELHAVPDLRGQTLANAQSVIKEQGFALGDVIRIKDKGHEPGTVIAQSPASPANIPVAKKIDLLVQDGAAVSANSNKGSVIIPDVNRMTEKEARNLLEASGLRVQTVDRVYSPVMPDGLAIETRPAAGTAVKPGDGVRLKIATLRRPAGYSDADSTPSNARKVTSNQNQNANANQNQNAAANANANQEQAQTQANNTTGRSVKVSVAGQDDVFIGDDERNVPIKEVDLNVSVLDQPGARRPVAANNNSSQQPKPNNAQANNNSNNNSSAGTGSKTARFRYQVPPLVTPMDIRIELTDPAGKRNLLNRRAKSGENISLEAKYDKECLITIYLGGEMVGQQRYR
ncbi:MAG: PASTA domain-containing protein [Synergistaceae bacterium]|nr:PASTA domain-containing protein [Synergistaceae bacterium]